jgi:aminopeptidase YwaD
VTARTARLVALVLAALASLAPATQGPVSLHLPPLDRVLPPRAERLYGALAGRVDGTAALETVRRIAPTWRLAGNPAFAAALAHVADGLVDAGFAVGGAATPPSTPGPHTWSVPLPQDTPAWEPLSGSLTIDGEADPVLSQARDRTTLCINAFSTPEGGVLAPLVDVGQGTRPADYAGHDVAGTIVLADGPVATVWERAVRERGAAGVVSTHLAAYTRPAETPDVLQWGAIPYDAARRSVAFKASPRATARLRARLARGATRVRVEVATRFHEGPAAMLVAEIPGATRPAERVVLMAHVQEPGANDNASGVATLLAVARAVQGAVAAGAVPPPARTLTFLWGDEIDASRAWLAADPARARDTVAMFSLDMTGQDTAQTGGTFLIEKMPDPSAVWVRPSDPHSEWGASPVDASLVRGHLLNDLHLAVALRRARDTGWVVRTNPYEGGSDHTSFLGAGVPALLDWHFTDRYYHTNLDTVDKVSPVTMTHVGVTVATTALFLASAQAEDAAPLRLLVDEAERARMATERANGASAEILAAWRRWYGEARASIARVAPAAESRR